jgi:branched-chain amino acid transport system substrate-binding protein
MKKAIVLIVGVVVLIGIVAFVYLSKSEKNQQAISIGVILPLTGDGAIYGDAIKKGIELAYSESNMLDKIKLVYDDDAGDTKVGINAFNNMVSRNIKIVIGGPMSHVASGLIPIANKEKILLLSPFASDPSLSQPGDYFYRICATDDVDGMVLAKFINNELKLEKVAVFYPNVDYGVGIRDAFQRSTKNTPIQIVFNESYQNGAVDFRTQLMKIKQSNPDVLLLPAYVKEGVIIMKQLNELDCDFFVASVSSFYEKSILEASGKLKNKTFFTYPLFSMESTNKKTQEFITKYREKYKEDPNTFAAHGFDSFNVLADEMDVLLKSGNKITQDKIKENLTQKHMYDGATGQFYFDENGDAIKDMQIIWLKEIDK